MVINGIDRKFLYTVGAYLAQQDLNIKNPKSRSVAYVVYMSVICNKAYEDAQKLSDPEYKPCYLTLEEVKALPLPAMRQLSTEVEKAIRDGSEITVATKKNEGADGQ